jgi:hypothetical protein
MRALLVAAILLAISITGYFRFLRHAPAPTPRAAELPAVSAAPVRSLEERAAAAQGTKYPVQTPDPPARAPDARPPPAAGGETVAQFRCDGRVYCSQMHSCEEATWFLHNCPGTKTDNEGRGDGVPCERQWCRRSKP